MLYVIENLLYHSEQLTPAVKNRLKKINWYVLDHPGCSLADIYNHSGATSNKEDVEKDIDHLILAEGLIRTKTTEKYFKEPIKDGFQESFSIHQILDDITDECSYNTSLQKSKFAKWLVKKSPIIKESNIGKVINKYKHRFDPKKPIGDPFLSKILIILFQRAKIFSTETRRIVKKQKKRMKDLEKYYQHQTTLLQKEMELVKKEQTASINKDSIKERRSKIQREKELLRTNHVIDLIRYEQINERTQGALESLNKLVDFLKFIVKNFNFYYNCISSHKTRAEELSARLDKIYDDDKLYNATFRSPRRKSLKELIMIQNCISLGCDQDLLATKHSYKNKKSMLKALEKIHDNSGNLDRNEIGRLQRMERGRILVPETSDEEILSLIGNHKLARGWSNMKFTSQEKKGKKIILDTKPYSQTI